MDSGDGESFTLNHAILDLAGRDFARACDEEPH